MAAVPPPALLNTLSSQQTYQPQGKRKDFHPHQSYFSKRSKGHYRDNQRYRHDNAHPQAVNTVGQARVRIGPTPRYETYKPLNATCVAIYPSIAHLIPKPMPRQSGYKPTKNMGTFFFYHEHNGHDGEKCITLCDHIEALEREIKIDRFLLHPSRDNRNQHQVNVIYSISCGTPISESSNRAMKNSERALRPGHQVFHVEDIRGGKYQKLNWDPICFYPKEKRGIIYPHNDPLIVEAHIANFEVRRILVDMGASVNIMFVEVFRALNVAEHLLDHSISPLISFFGDIMQPLGSMHLPFTIGTGPYTATITTNFLVVDCPTAYNFIFGRTGINNLKAMVSTHILLMKFPTLDMKEPVTSKDIQSLTGKVAALTRFISKATDRCAHFFKSLKGSKKYITWTDECAEAFKNLKEYMSKAHLLSKPEVGDTLIIYLSVSTSAVSSVLIRKDGNVKRPVYDASKTLQDVETRYSNIEKLALALVMSARKLSLYFQAQSIIVLTNHPLRQILQSPDTSG
ncbi:hypothetical protein ACFX12_000374 [Malus domestica]